MPHTSGPVLALCELQPCSVDAASGSSSSSATTSGAKQIEFPKSRALQLRQILGSPGPLRGSAPSFLTCTAVYSGTSISGLQGPEEPNWGVEEGLDPSPYPLSPSSTAAQQVYFPISWEGATTQLCSAPPSSMVEPRFCPRHPKTRSSS